MSFNSENQPQLSDEISADYTAETAQPNADSSGGTVNRDIIDVSANQIAKAYLALDAAQQTASLKNAVTTSADALSQYAMNFDVLVAPPSKATGTVIFRAIKLPTYPISLPIGTVVQTLPESNGSVTKYTTSQDAVFPIDAPFNPITGYYEVEVAIEAENSGTSEHVGANALIALPLRINGISSVANDLPISNASDGDTNTDIATNVRAKTAGTDLATPSGYVTLIKNAFTNNVFSAAIVGPYDTDNKRVEFYNEVDVPIISAVNAQSFTTILTSSGSQQTYFSTERPVVSVSSVVGTTNGVNYAANVDYSFLPDTSTVYGYSTRSFDALSWITFMGPGVELSVQGTRYGMVGLVQDFLNDPEKRYITGNILVREAQKILIDITTSVAADAGVDRTQLQTDISTALNNALAAYAQGDDVLEDDILQIIDAVDGVQYVEPLTVFKKSTDSVNADNTIIIRAQEYARLGTLTLTIS